VTRLDVEVGPDERAHIAGREGGLPDRARVLARAHDESLRRRSPASRSTSSVFGKQNRIVEHPLRIPKDLARPGWPEAALECISRQSTSTAKARDRVGGATPYWAIPSVSPFPTNSELSCKSHRTV